MLREVLLTKRRTNKIGPKTHPWVTPACSINTLDSLFFRNPTLYLCEKVITFYQFQFIKWTWAGDVEGGLNRNLNQNNRAGSNPVLIQTDGLAKLEVSTHLFPKSSKKKHSHFLILNQKRFVFYYCLRFIYLL